MASRADSGVKATRVRGVGMPARTNALVVNLATVGGEHAEEVALRNANMGIWDWDVTTNQVDWSDEHAVLFGMPLDQFGGTIDDAPGEALIDWLVEAQVLTEFQERAVRQALERQKKRSELQLSGGAQQTLRRGPFTADLDSHRVVQNGKLLNLTPQEFTLLVYMMQNAGEAISPMDLVEVVRHCKPEYLNEARQIVKWYIHHLRKKVELDPSNPRYIVNVRRVGYLFEP